MTGQHIGYIRVSTAGQSTARQLDGVALDRVFEEKASAKGRAGRPALAECLAYCRRGDVLHVHSMDRLARNLDDLRKIVQELTTKGVVVRFETEGLAFGGDDSPMSMLLLSMLGAVAEFERSMIRERQREGIAVAKAKGAYTGRRPSLTNEQAAELKRRAGEGEGKTALAKEFGISRESVYNYIRPSGADDRC